MQNINILLDSARYVVYPPLDFLLFRRGKNMSIPRSFTNLSELKLPLVKEYV